MITLGAPNDNFTVGFVSNGDGTTHFDFSLPDPTFTWEPSYAPGHTTIIVEAQRSFDNCNSTTPAGVLCGVSYNVFGNSADLFVDVQDAVTITFNAVAIPEPGTWLLMLTGVLGVGAALRLRRRSLRVAQTALA